MNTDTDMVTSPSVADEVQKALAIERKRERERTEEQQKKAARYEGEPGAYLREQGEAQQRAWMLRTEAMYRNAEKKQIAEEKHAGELAEVTSEMSAVEKRHDQRLAKIAADAERAREEAQAEFIAERKLVKRRQTELQQVIEVEASSVERGKRLFGFPRKRGAK